VALGDHWVGLLWIILLKFNMLELCLAFSFLGRAEYLFTWDL